MSLNKGYACITWCLGKQEAITVCTFVLLCGFVKVLFFCSRQQVK